MRDLDMTEKRIPNGIGCIVFILIVFFASLLSFIVPIFLEASLDLDGWIRFLYSMFILIVLTPVWFYIGCSGRFQLDKQNQVVHSKSKDVAFAIISGFLLGAAFYGAATLL